MPDRALLYSPLAQRDLDEIFDYIATELENPSSAAGTVNAILDAAESLVGSPYTGSPVRGLPFTAEEYRFTNTRNYLIFYRVTETCIFVDRILYKRRDYIPLLGLQ
jgi:plasmid stabilization system protein ParE